MMSLRYLPIRHRLWLILGLFLLVLIIQGAFQLKQSYQDLHQGKSEKTQHLVEGALGILAHYHRLESQGVMSREQAQQAAQKLLGELRYGADDYFWINDLHPRMVMHPTNPKLNGESLQTYKDPDGTELFNVMVSVVREKGAGTVEYRWPKPGHETPVPKISYVQLFEPWGWILGTGVYIDDIRDQFFNQTVKTSAIGLVIMILIGILLALITRSITRPLEDAVQAMTNIASGDADLTRRLETRGRDEIRDMAEQFNSFAAKLQQMVERLLKDASSLQTSADHLNEVAGNSQQSCHQQSEQMEQVATAVAQVSLAVQEVAQSAEQASNEVNEAEAQARQGRANIDQSLEQIGQLSARIGQAVEVIEGLAEESTQIGTVVEVIRGIAEQTNLLALNAAIEAARAGEQGRGFAVVADEVRLLAQRTQQSTAEIQQMIERLQGNSTNAVKVIAESNQATQLTVEQAELARSTLEHITSALRNLAGVNASIASATLEQSQVIEDINGNVTLAARLAQEIEQSADQTLDAGKKLNQLAAGVNRLLGQFRV
ncbi:MAG TPA: methyl-accepting chemotaxis protein [Pseudomonas sp.]|nr:methyl-accepting chemotaxis protein [Pseudomonas sp.]